MLVLVVIFIKTLPIGTQVSSHCRHQQTSRQKKGETRRSRPLQYSVSNYLDRYDVLRLGALLAFRNGEF